MPDPMPYRRGGGKEEEEEEEEEEDPHFPKSKPEDEAPPPPFEPNAPSVKTAHGILGKLSSSPLMAHADRKIHMKNATSESPFMAESSLPSNSLRVTVHGGTISALLHDNADGTTEIFAFAVGENGILKDVRKEVENASDLSINALATHSLGLALATKDQIASSTPLARAVRLLTNVAVELIIDRDIDCNIACGSAYETEERNAF
jgi:hypothetical protein